MEDQYYSINEFTSAFDALKLARVLLEQEDKNWPWIVVSNYIALYDSCIALLVNGNWESVTYTNTALKSYYYSTNELNWNKMIIKKIEKTKFFRITWADASKEEKDSFINQIKDFNFDDDNSLELYDKSKVISFQYALARVMDGKHFFARYVCQNPLILTDDEIKEIDYIHDIRNQIMHFKPIYALLDIKKIKQCLITYINSTNFLLFKSGSNIHWEDRRDEVEQNIKVISGLLT